ncbi:MAG: mechanosensitive ion channel family protein [Sulfuricellaceae bacterium]|nr:mechanosensitive ion channel family protein [Sulfuricellaceae bacterium]
MPRIILLALFSLITCLSLVQAAESFGASPAQEESETAAFAPVTLDGKVLFQVRSVPTLSAGQRADGISSRITKFADDAATPLSALQAIEEEGRIRVTAGDHFIMYIFDSDVGTGGLTRKLYAEIGLDRVRKGITAYRHNREPEVLWRNAAYALGVTLAMLASMFVLSRLAGRVRTMLENKLSDRITELEKKSFQLVNTRQMYKLLRGALRTTHVALALALTYFYLVSVLSLFPWTQSLAQNLLSLFISPLRTMGMGVLAALPSLIFLIILFFVTRFFLRLIRLFFNGLGMGGIAINGFEADWAEPTYKIVRVLIIAFALVVAYPYIPGSSSDAFKGISIFIGVIFSLGSSSFIANMIAGYTMIYRRAFKIGDRIKVGDAIGDVTATRLMVTHLRTVKNEEIVIPNSMILSNNIINYSTLAKSRGLILHATVGIGYETPWRQVDAMLKLAAERTPGLLKDPAPFVHQKELGDFAVTYEINVYTDNSHSMAGQYTELYKQILDVFNEYGIQIMTPAYEGDPEMPKLVPKDQWFTAPAKQG